MKIKLIALFIMMRSLAAIADNDTYFFSKVDYQQGLSNSAVLCLFQDNVGLMWFGTYDGVNCWDYNRQIKKFPTEKQNVSLKHILT